MKKIIFVILASLLLAQGTARANSENPYGSRHSKKHSSKKHPKKKGKKSKHKKENGAELESQITDKGVQFNVKADSK